jgi:hypothetical protein
MRWEKEEYQLWDDIFPNTTLEEFLNRSRDHVTSICWLCQYKKLNISKGAWELIAGKAERSTWAAGYKTSKHFAK